MTRGGKLAIDFAKIIASPTHVAAEAIQSSAPAHLESTLTVFKRKMPVAFVSGTATVGLADVATHRMGLVSIPELDSASHLKAMLPELECQWSRRPDG